jgi:hypothetical protein
MGIVKYGKKWNELWEMGTIHSITNQALEENGLSFW